MVNQGLLDDEERYRINVFDWNSEFPQAFSSPPGRGTQGEGKGGFDAVIGNPPYVRIQGLKEWAPIEVEHYKKAYQSASKGNYDIYVVFVEKGLSLLNKAGRLGFILPHKFFNAQYGQPLREVIAKGRHLGEVVHFGDQQVFAGATTYTCLLFLDKAASKHCRFVKVNDLPVWRSNGEASESSVPASRITEAEWNFSVGKGAELFERLSKMPVKLGHLAHIFVGTQTSADDVFVLDECSNQGKYVIGLSRLLGKKVKVEAACTLPFLYGKQIRRYDPPETDSRLICPYLITEKDCRIFTEHELSRQFPLTLAYLQANKQTLVAREKGRFRGDDWYAFGYPKSMTLFQKPKLIVPDYNNRASFTFDVQGHFFKTGYGVLLNNDSLSPVYVLGLLNSSLLFRYLLSIGTSLRGGYVRFWTKYLEPLPIRTINFSDPADKARHDKVVSLVKRMLDLHKQLPATQNPNDKTRLQREIDATDRQIDQLVYELYGLTEEEIKIVEGLSL